MTAKKKTNPLVYVLIGCGGLFVLGLVVFFAVTAFLYKKGKEIVENPEIAYAHMIDLSPELDLVKTDKKAKTFTFRHTETGEEYQVNFEQLQDGKLSIRNNAGEEVFSFDADENGGRMKMRGEDGQQVTMETDDQGNAVVTSENEDGTATATYNQDGGTVQGSEGSTMSYGGDVSVDSFLDWMPRWGGDSLKPVNSIKSGSTVGGSYSFHFDGTLDELAAMVKEDLEAKGLTFGSQSTMPNGAMLNYSDEKRNVILIVGEATGGGYDAVVNFSEEQ